jgi:hypothetical protein
MYKMQKKTGDAEFIVGLYSVPSSGAHNKPAGTDRSRKDAGKYFTP